MVFSDTSQMEDISTVGQVFFLFLPGFPRKPARTEQKRLTLCPVRAYLLTNTDMSATRRLTIHRLALMMPLKFLGAVGPVIVQVPCDFMAINPEIPEITVQILPISGQTVQIIHQSRLIGCDCRCARVIGEILIELRDIVSEIP